MQSAPGKRPIQTQADLLTAVQEAILPAVKAGVTRPMAVVAPSQTVQAQQDQAPTRLGSSQGTSRAGPHFLFVLDGEISLPLTPALSLRTGACCLMTAENFNAGGKPCFQTTSAYSRLLQVESLSSGVFCHIDIFRNGMLHSPGPLFVPDSQLGFSMQQVQDELLNRDYDFEAIAAAHLLAFFLRLQRALLKTPAIPTSIVAATVQNTEGQLHEVKSDSTEVQRARLHIESNLQSHLTLISIAAHVHTSPSHLNRLFNLSLRTSVMKYVATRRIEAAKSLLIQTDLAVHIVGQLTGYPQHAHFTQTFAQHVKLAPQEYRKRYKIDRRGI